MSPLTDDQLLRRFAEHRDAEAFGRLVERHARLVHATCRRETGDEALAEDAAQTVFLLLARKARSLRAERSLASWLFAASRLASRNLLRAERRRRAREARASVEMERTMNSESQEAIEPHLNEALARLRPADRQAVILRFLEGRSFAEVAAEMQLGESAARMRVNRAIEQLRANLGRAGVTVSAAGLVLVLDRNAEAAIPSHLLSAVSVPSTASSGGGLGMWPVLAKGTILALTTTTKSLVAASALTLLLGGGFIAVRNSTKIDDETIRAGFRPLIGQWAGVTNASSFSKGRTGMLGMQMDFQPEDGGRKLKFTIKVPEIHHHDRKVMTLDPYTGHMIVTMPNGKVEDLAVSGFGELAAKGKGTISMIGKPSDRPGTSQTRVSLSVDGSHLTIRQENVPFKGVPGGATSEVQEIRLEKAP